VCLLDVCIIQILTSTNVIIESISWLIKVTAPPVPHNRTLLNCHKKYMNTETDSAVISASV